MVNGAWQTKSGLAVFSYHQRLVNYCELLLLAEYLEKSESSVSGGHDNTVIRLLLISFLLRSIPQVPQILEAFSLSL